MPRYFCALAASVLGIAAAARGDNTKDVNVVNTPAVTVANTPGVTVENTPAVTVANTPAVTVANTPSVNVANSPTVNVANFPDPQGAGPAAASDLVDLVQNSPCPGFEDQAAKQFDGVVTADGVRTGFAVPSGKVLVLTDVDVMVTAGFSAAGDSVIVTLIRGGSPFAFKSVVLDSRGNGTVSFSFPSGSRFNAPACVRTQRSSNGAFVAALGSAHGHLALDR